MAVRNIAGKDIDFDAEGYMSDRTAWNEDIARAIGAEEGIDPLTDRHWIVLNFMRKEFEAKGDATHLS